MHRSRNAFRDPHLRGVALLAALLLLAAHPLACARSGGPGGAAGAHEAERVEFGRWHEDWLHCAEGRCAVLYRVHVGEAGRLRADVYAPWGGEYPEFDLVLLDGQLAPIARPAKPNARPRRIEHAVGPGEYFLRIEGRGESDGRLKFDLVAQLDGVPHAAPPKPSAPPAPPPTPSPVVREAASTPTPVVVEEPSAARSLLVQAWVLDLESEQGAQFVLLDAGRPQQVAPEMRGELLDHGRPIGEIVIVDVFEDGSRARIVGELSGEIGIDTVAHIYH